MSVCGGVEEEEEEVWVFVFVSIHTWMDNNGRAHKSVNNLSPCSLMHFFPSSSVIGNFLSMNDDKTRKKSHPTNIAVDETEPRHPSFPLSIATRRD